jgi:O-acetyl-ADP-ribose deacetylase (regulator of RNase III)
MIMGISYVVGDATKPQGEGLMIVAHVCNDAGGFGSGFAGAVARCWPEVRNAYLKWHAKGEGFALGMVQLATVSDSLIVANMIAQHGYSRPGKPAINYLALRMCLSKVAKKAGEIGASIHAPRLGSGLAGGTWDQVEPIILETMDGLEVTIYDLPEAK